MFQTHFAKTTLRGAAASLTVLTALLITGLQPAAAQNGRTGRLHIVKDCGSFTGVPGSSFCQIVSSDLPELPSGAKIYYDEISGGPTAGSGFLDSNIFIYISETQWAVGRCTIANDNTPGLCSITDGVGLLEGLSARIVVTYVPGGDGAKYSWDGTYTFAPKR